MTTYTTPHYANDLPDRNVRTASDKESIRHARGAETSAARSGDMSGARTVDWQPGASKGVPKAAIGALGATIVGGIALAIVLISPSNKITKPATPDPIAAAATQSTAPAVDPVATLSREAPAAGPAATTAAVDATTAQRARDAAMAAQAAVAKTPVEATTPAAAAAPRTAPVATRATHRAETPAAMPHPDAQQAPAVTPEAPVVARVVTPQVESPAPAMQQTPAAPNLSPSLPTPDVGAMPTPAPGGNE